MGYKNYSQSVITGIVEDYHIIQEHSKYFSFEEMMKGSLRRGLCLQRALIIGVFFPEKYELKFGSCGVVPRNNKKNKKIWWEYGNGRNDFKECGMKEYEEERMEEVNKRMMKVMSVLK